MKPYSKKCWQRHHNTLPVCRRTLDKVIWVHNCITSSADTNPFVTASESRVLSLPEETSSVFSLMLWVITGQHDQIDLLMEGKPLCVNNMPRLYLSKVMESSRELNSDCFNIIWSSHSYSCFTVTESNGKPQSVFKHPDKKWLIQTEMTLQLSKAILSGLSAMAVLLVFLHLWRDSVKRTHPESPYKDKDSRRVGDCVNSRTSVYRHTHPLQSCSNKSKKRTVWYLRCVSSANNARLELLQ